VHSESLQNSTDSDPMTKQIFDDTITTFIFQQIHQPHLHPTGTLEVAAQFSFL
jgi:hypothetical protein